MDTNSAKIELVKLIIEIEDPALIQKIQHMLMDESSKFKKSLNTDERDEIELGLKQLNRGERIAFEDFLKKVS